MFQILLIYEVDPQLRNPNAIILIIISSEKITVKNLSNTFRVIKNPDLGSLNGLSAAS